MNNNQIQPTNQPKPNRFRLKTWQWVSVLAVLAVIAAGVFVLWNRGTQVSSPLPPLKEYQALEEYQAEDYCEEDSDCTVQHTEGTLCHSCGCPKPINIYNVKKVNCPSLLEEPWTCNSFCPPFEVKCINNQCTTVFLKDEQQPVGNNQPCIFKDRSCCKGEVCKTVDIKCIEGTEDQILGCDENCEVIYECKKNNSNSEASIIKTDIPVTKITNFTSPTYINHLDIYGNTIVWSDNSAGVFNVYTYNTITNKKEAIKPMPADQTQPAIYEDKIVWVQATSPDNYELYLDNITTKQGTILKKPAVKSFGPSWPDIYGNTIVWEEQGVETGTINTASQIYALNIETNELKKLSSPSEGGYEQANTPKIYDTIVVWTDRRDPSNAHIYKYDLDKNQESSITSAWDLGARVLHQWPNIYQDKVVWHQALRDLYAYDTKSNQIIWAINLPNLKWESFINIYSDKVVFKGCEESINKCDIYLFNLNDPRLIINLSKSQKVPANNVWTPALYQNKIVWIEENDSLGKAVNNLYMAEVDTNNDE